MKNELLRVNENSPVLWCWPVSSCFSESPVLVFKNVLSEQGSEESGSADGGKSRNQKDSVGSKCAENSGPGMRFTRSQRCILLSLTAPT